jgi:hypothetical protein
MDIYSCGTSVVDLFLDKPLYPLVWAVVLSPIIYPIPWYIYDIVFKRPQYIKEAEDLRTKEICKIIRKEQREEIRKEFVSNIISQSKKIEQLKEEIKRLKRVEKRLIEIECKILSYQYEVEEREEKVDKVSRSKHSWLMRYERFN